MHTTYYDRFTLFTERRHWDKYLQWAYPKCIKDLEALNYYPDFTKKDFTAMLCGTSGARTAINFVQFVLSKNPHAKIIILDISEPPIEQSKKALTIKFPEAHIHYVRSDAKNSNLPSRSIDYIETDAFFEFFNASDLTLLLIEWERLLKKDGFATTRAFASRYVIEKPADLFRRYVATRYLEVKIHIHHRSDIINAIKKTGLQYVQKGDAFIPTFKRFALLKSS